MPPQISELVKNTWPKCGDRVKCLFGTEEHEGVVKSASHTKGTCKVTFASGVEGVNLKHPKWGVVLERKKKKVNMPYDRFACAHRQS
jgi:hypothetical protein